MSLELTRVIFNTPVPLNVTMHNKSTSKVVRASIYDMADDSLLTATPIVVPHIANGYYKDDSFLMPNTERIKVIYQIFEGDGITPSTDTVEQTEDTFALDQIISVDSIVGVVSDEDDIIGTSETDQAIYGILDCED